VINVSSEKSLAVISANDTQYIVSESGRIIRDLNAVSDNFPTGSDYGADIGAEVGAELGAKKPAYRITAKPSAGECPTVTGHIFKNLALGGRLEQDDEQIDNEQRRLVFDTANVLEAVKEDKENAEWLTEIDLADNIDIKFRYKTGDTDILLKVGDEGELKTKLNIALLLASDYHNGGSGIIRIINTSTAIFISD
jgi:hypothetical protein